MDASIEMLNVYSRLSQHRKCECVCVAVATTVDGYKLPVIQRRLRSSHYGWTQRAQQIHSHRVTRISSIGFGCWRRTTLNNKVINSPYHTRSRSCYPSICPKLIAQFPARMQISSLLLWFFAIQIQISDRQHLRRVEIERRARRSLNAPKCE